MEHTKFIVLLTIVASATSNDLTLGQGDRGLLVYNITVEASPAIWRQIDTIVVNATRDKVISKIDITDLRPEKDGEAKITDGGIGLKDVTIELKSPTVLRGYKFQVQVFEEAPSTRGISTTEGAKGNQDNKHPSIVGQDLPNFEQARTNLDDTKSHGHIPVLSTSSTTDSSRKYPEYSSRNTRDAIKAEPSPPVAGVKDSDKEHASSTLAPNNNKNAETKDAKQIETEAKSFAEMLSSSAPKLTADAPKTNVDAAKTTPHPALTPEVTTKHNTDHKRDTKEATEKPVKISAVKNDMNLEPKDAKGNDTGVKSLTDASTVTPATHLASTSEPKTNMEAAKTTPVSFSHEATTKHSADHKRDTKEAGDKGKLPTSKNDKNHEAKDLKTNDTEAKTSTDVPAANPTTSLGSTEEPKTNMDATKTSPHPVGVTPETVTKHSADHKRDTKEAADKPVLPEIKNGKGLEAKDAKLNETEAKSLTDIPTLAPINPLASTSVPKTNLDTANTTPVTVHSESTTKHSTDHKRDTKDVSDKLVKGSVTDFTTEAVKKHENIDHKLNKDNIKTSDLPKVNMKSDSTTKHDVEHKMNEDKNMPMATGISEKDLNPYGPAPVIDDFDFEAQLPYIMTRNKDAKTKAIGSDLKPDAPESTHDVKNDAMNLNKNGQITKDDIENTKPYPYLSRPQTPSGNAKLESTTKHSEHKRDTKDDKHKDTKENNPKETKEVKMEKSESKTVDEVKNAAHDKATATKTGAELKPIVSLQ